MSVLVAGYAGRPKRPRQVRIDLVCKLLLPSWSLQTIVEKLPSEGGAVTDFMLHEVLVASSISMQTMRM